MRAKLCVPARDDVVPIAGAADSKKYGVCVFRVCVPVPFPLCRNVKVIEKLF